MTYEPIRGTIVPVMSTIACENILSLTLFGKTRRSVLGLLYSHTDESFYLRQIARAAGAGMGAVQRELRQLTEAGILRRTIRGRHAYYQANSASPIYAELKSIIIKTAGIADILKSALAPLLERISIAFIYGSFAERTESSNSDIDLMIAGDVSFEDTVFALSQSQTILQREINPTVYSESEFREKLSIHNHFLAAIMKRPKIFLIGDVDELKRMAKKRLAQ